MPGKQDRSGLSIDRPTDPPQACDPLGRRFGAGRGGLSGPSVQHGELVSVIEEVDKILAEQAVFQASKQITSRRLQALVNQGGKLTTVLKVIAKQRYGHGNDKLVEFGIQPLRSRPKPTVVPPAAPPPAEAAGPPATSVPTSTNP